MNIDENLFFHISTNGINILSVEEIFTQKYDKNVTSPHICDNINLCTTQPIVSGTIFITPCS